MKSILVFSSWLMSTSFVSAAYMSSNSDNIAVYWGQNSAGGDDTQRPLIDVCRGVADIDKGLNFANSDRPTEYGLVTLTYEKTLILSLGGAATDNTWAFASPDKAVDAANRLWAAFGPESSSAGNSTLRPFGSAAVDGFDLDFEAPYANIQVFTQQLRKLMDQEKARKFYLSAAPQCPFPDMNLSPVLLGDTATALDFVFIQFYNNPPCDLRSPGGFRASLGDWDSQWAKKSGAKIFVGVPGAPTAAGGGSYVEGAAFAADALKTAQKIPSFAGVMVWDMSQLDKNTEFLPPIVSALSSSAAQPATGNRTMICKHGH
ncbi:glycoside hydrolase superfamily [Nemania sp. NC0429]|nr:glycoside hydrolase superfamily [Nemania sp. NC0429]